MKAIAQNEIISLVSDINAFADRAELLINNTQANYERTKKQLNSKHEQLLSSLDSSYHNACNSIKMKSDKTIAEAHSIMQEITKLDAQLTSVDKYYVKTKKKKEEALSDKKSSHYDDATDYFDTLEDIKKSFTVIYKKYSEDILPALINGLNYLFSAKRKQDYEELIVLRNTVAAFITEIEEELPTITQDNLASIKVDYKEKRAKILISNQAELDAFEEKYNITLNDVAEKIYCDLDEILPDEFVDYIYTLSAQYNTGRGKVNSSSVILNDVFNMMFVDYPVDFFVQSTIVASIIKDKCAKLISNGSIRLPIAFSSNDAPVWQIINDNSNASAVQMFTHSIMFGFLSTIPVSKISYSIVDPENRGNSIFPFFDAKKKLPDLFGDKIFITKDDVIVKISQLNEKIESILQETLGNQYDTIFDFAMNNHDFDVNLELLILYDFPKGFDERSLAELRNILRNGHRCGIYTLISYIPVAESVYSQEYERALASIAELTTNIQQNGQEFLLRGLPLSYFHMPDKSDFARFFSKYMLIFEGIKNRGIAFSPIIKKLVDSKDSLELESHIDYICDMMSTYNKQYASVPDIDISFPKIVTLGTVLYPADIFSESIGYNKIIEKFGVGVFTNEEAGYIELPITFDLRKSFNLFLNCPEQNSRQILEFTHHVIWSFLSFMPVTKVRISVCDGEQRGNSIIPFLDFRKKCPDIFDEKIYTSVEAVNGLLHHFNSYIDEFIQEKLGNKYHDILEYNTNTPSRAEPITLLILYDFPSSMDSRSMDLLTNILRNGNKCGVFTIICYNPNVTYSRYESIDDRIDNITRFCSVIDYKDNHYGLLPYNLQINIPEALPNHNIELFINDYYTKSEIIKKQGLSFKDILSDELFSYTSAKKLSIPIGIGDGDSIIELTIGEGSSHHGLIAGATGSGKSTLLHTLIMSAMLHYSPDQLHLYLMDFKSGTEFKIYETVKLPHIQLLALDAMQEFGESILENLVKEMEKRGDLFKEVGQTSLRGYVEETGKPLPRILVIMDEFQILFNDSTNRKVAMHCAELTKRLVTEGRAFGIHLLMATQSTKVISDLTLSHGTIEQMRIRIGLKCGENDARYLFSDQNDTKALEMMKGPIGTAVLNLDYTEEPNIGFRAAYCDDETQKNYLELIGSTFVDYPYSLQTFEGGRTTSLLDYYNKASIGRTDKLPVKIYMGDLIKVADPFEIVIDKKKKHNLLICGSNDYMSNMISNNFIIASLLNNNSSVYCIDGDKLVGDDNSQDYYEAFAQLSKNFYIAEDRSDIIQFIRDIYIKFAEWKKHNSSDLIFVVIKNLQFLDIVKTMFKGEQFDESEYLDVPTDTVSENTSLDPFAAVNSMFANKEASDNMSTGEKLIKMIEEGSGFGIYFVVTSMDYQTVRETMYYGENILSKFPERIIFSLGSNDAENLIENVSVSGLRSNTVYYTDGIKNTFQLKPYVTPSPQTLINFIQNEL